MRSRGITWTRNCRSLRNTREELSHGLTQRYRRVRGSGSGDQCKSVFICG
jgi:hypothetical protein